MNALVTGATGFVGPWLVRELLEAGYRVRGLADRPGPLPRGVPLTRARLEKLRGSDLRGARPDVVFHLAAISNVPFSRARPRTTFEVNALGTARLFRALDDARLAPRIVLVGSADIYASHPRPIREDGAVRPLNPYSASKLCAEAIGRGRRDLDIVLLRPFNHLGPGQSPGFAAPDFAEQIARAETGRIPPRIRVGDLTPVRDFTDVRDIARAYRLAAERGRRGETYNISSDRGVPIGTLLDALLDLARKRLRVVRDSARTRGDSRSVRVGCSRKFRRRTGWVPLIPFPITLRDLLEYHRRRVRGTIRSG